MWEGMFATLEHAWCQKEIMLSCFPAHAHVPMRVILALCELYCMFPVFTYFISVYPFLHSMDLLYSCASEWPARWRYTADWV